MTDTETLSPATVAELADTPYQVDLVLSTAADGPIEAVEKAMQMVLEYGMRTWSYRVTHRETGEVTIVHREATYSVESYRALVESETRAREGD